MIIWIQQELSSSCPDPFRAAPIGLPYKNVRSTLFEQGRNMSTGIATNLPWHTILVILKERYLPWGSLDVVDHMWLQLVIVVVLVFLGCLVVILMPLLPLLWLWVSLSLSSSSEHIPWCRCCDIFRPTSFNAQQAVESGSLGFGKFQSWPMLTSLRCGFQVVY